jgi:hypothetical protein
LKAFPGLNRRLGGERIGDGFAEGDPDIACIPAATASFPESFQRRQTLERMLRNWKIVTHCKFLIE